MPYLQTILDTEESAKKTVDAAELEATRVLAETRTALAKKEELARGECAAERAAAITAQTQRLQAEREEVLAQARTDVARLEERVLPKQDQTIAHIKGLMVE